MFKFLFDILIDPLGLPIEWYKEYLILAVIGAVAYSIAFRCVGDMYHIGMIDGRTSGSFFHWLIRLVLFVVLWAITYGVIVAAKWLAVNWVMFSGIVGGISAIAGIVAIAMIMIRNHKRKKEVATNARDERKRD